MQSGSIETPVMLVAMPQIVDPFFWHSIVLLIEYTDEGSLGIVINRPTELKVADVLHELEIPWTGDPDEIVHLGGPVQPQLGSVLYRAEENGSDETSAEIVDGLCVSQNIETLRRIAASLPFEIKLVLGYAGWSAGQLDEELQRHDWLIAPVDIDQVFAPDAENVWERVLHSIGIRPESLPTVQHTGSDEVPS
jgi:putative transcriptional regulator